MISDKKIAANRENAKRSTGPRTGQGQRRIRRNSFRHGLAVDVGSESSLSADIELMAKAIESATGQKPAVFSVRKLAEAEIDLLRIRTVRAELLKSFYNKEEIQAFDYVQLNANLGKLERYERRAFSRHKRALRAIS